jgi:uncharacterized protein YacL
MAYGSATSTGLGAQFGVNTAGGLAGGNVASANYQGSASVNGAVNAIPWVIVSFVVLYLVWAMVEQHERVRNAIEPSNVAINVRNLAFVAFTAILGIVILKVAFTKLTAWNVPGAAQVLQVIAAA